MKRPMPNPAYKMADQAKAAKTYARAAANPRVKAVVAARKVGSGLTTRRAGKAPAQKVK